MNKRKFIETAEIYNDLYISYLKLKDYDERVYKAIEKTNVGNYQKIIYDMILYHEEIENVKMGKISNSIIYKFAERRYSLEKEYHDEFHELGMKIGYERTMKYIDLFMENKI